MINVSVVIPTHNRPHLLKKAITSVLNQDYKDFELIVVDDGLSERADQVVGTFHDPRIVYIKNEKEMGGSVARNNGIKASQGNFIALLDDDDEWVPEKLKIQMDAFESTPSDVGFCFCAVINLLNEKKIVTQVPEGIADYHKRALSNFKSFLTVTLIIKKEVFGVSGMFDEKFPSHQEADLMIRITRNFKGLGINKPLVLVNMSHDADQVGRNQNKKILGRKMILSKYGDEFRLYPGLWAHHCFQLGIWYRDAGDFRSAAIEFKKSISNKFMFRYLFHYLATIFNGKIYRFLNKLRS
ncbi:glycosyltransferase family 2 protein [Candidatus Parcubacteria bacterium]|nr:glycosyltransferase family 2 protein [Candidatus Parcubacteria bacterium]